MDHSDHEGILLKIARLEKLLADLSEQKAAAELELQSLRKELAISNHQNADLSNTSPSSTIDIPRPLTSAEKVALFRRLFQGRDDVYPKLWLNSKTGKKGYSPACDNE